MNYGRMPRRNKTRRRKSYDKLEGLARDRFKMVKMGNEYGSGSKNTGSYNSHNSSL